MAVENKDVVVRFRAKPSSEANWLRCAAEMKQRFSEWARDALDAAAAAQKKKGRR